MVRIKRGLDIPITGAPEQRIETARAVHHVAVIGFDYHGLKPTMAVQVGDRVQKGQPLFSDKKNPGVQVTAPASGTISAINRGERRVLQSVVIEVGDESAPDAALRFAYCSPDKLASLSGEAVRENLQRSGLWTALRTRPFSKIPAVDATPAHIFVTAIDTHPLAANPVPIIAERADNFRNGLAVLTRLAPVFLCRAPGSAPRGACAFLGRYDLQVSCLHEGTDRQMLHFLRPGFDKHSVSGAFVWKLFGRKPLAMTTTTNGSPRAMVPTGTYEAVMPLDILPTQLLRSLIVGDTEMAQKLGCLELDEEDLALCTYACAGKYEYGPILRDNLTRIEKEG